MTSTLTASAWDGRTGGILAFDVAGALALNGVTASAGRPRLPRRRRRVATPATRTRRRPTTCLLDAENAHGRKGEGIACTPSSLSGVPGAPTGTDGCPAATARAALPATAAAAAPTTTRTINDENTGGGGGGNGGAGGAGRQLLEQRTEPIGGRGGVVFPAARGTPDPGRRRRRGRVEQRWAPATVPPAAAWSSSAPALVSGTGTINVNGANAACSGQDGGGGGGAGGSVVIYSASGVLTA